MVAEEIQQPGRGFTDDAAVKLFWFVALLHVAVWSLLPIATQPNGSLDALEMLYWGHEWQAGYFKHPPLPGWLAETAVTIGGASMVPIYVLAQLCTFACFWSVFAVAKECLGKRGGVLCVLLLEACYYFHYTTTEFNNNVVSRACWALTIAFLYRGLVKQQLGGWLAAGLTLGLGCLAKYDTGVLAVTMLVFAVGHPRGRAALKTPGPWLALGVALLVFAPHVKWLIDNDFPTVAYFLRRSGQDEHRWINHLLNPLKFIGSQAGACLPICAMAWPMFGWRWRRRTSATDEERLNRDFVLTFAGLPLVIVLSISLLAGVQLRSMWGTAMWTYFGLLLMTLFEARQDSLAVRRQVKLAGGYGSVAVIALIVHDVGLPEFRGETSRIHFPGRQLAERVDDAYQARTGQAPAIVGGPAWIASNVAFYLPRRATVYADLNPSISPWTSDAELARQGGVIVWPIEPANPDWDADIRRRFANLVEVSPVEVLPQSFTASDTLKFRVAIVPPTQAE